MKEGQKVLVPAIYGLGERAKMAPQPGNVARFASRNSRVILLGIVLLSAAGL